MQAAIVLQSNQSSVIDESLSSFRNSSSSARGMNMVSLLTPIFSLELSYDETSFPTTVLRDLTPCTTKTEQGAWCRT